ncbi:hypothetical protein CEXT_325901 [Caerostris extrusa]|uniref:Uncharacterized protein n=1 Tax=Caerostris extrusa TaxID=172846 RepID=A0AAV4SE02_CAEEX|nr:hypothetical protein CEXT_325901 [Caerostris extrusa]
MGFTVRLGVSMLGAQGKTPTDDIFAQQTPQLRRPIHQGALAVSGAPGAPTKGAIENAPRQNHSQRISGGLHGIRQMCRQTSVKD